MSCGVGHRFHFAVAVVKASSYSSDKTPSLRTSICRGCGPKKRHTHTHKKKKRKEKKNPKRQLTEWEKVVSNEAIDKGLISTIYKQLNTTQ